MSLVFKLYRLQQVDSQLDQCHARLQEIEAILGDDRALVQARAQVEQAAAVLDEKRKALRRAEENTRAQHQKIKQTETRLYSGAVTDTKELQDLHREAAALKRFLTVLEDRQLEAMLVVDEAEAAEKEAREALETLQASWVEQTASLRGEQSSLQKDVARLEAERQAAAASIPPEQLQEYEHLRRQRGGVAVAQVVDKTCAACGSTLNAALLQAARSPTQTTRCSFCGRILYAS